MLVNVSIYDLLETFALIKIKARNCSKIVRFLCRLCEIDLRFVSIMCLEKFIIVEK